MANGIEPDKFEWLLMKGIKEVFNVSREELRGKPVRRKVKMSKDIAPGSPSPEEKLLKSIFGPDYVHKPETPEEREARAKRKAELEAKYGPI